MSAIALENKTILVTGAAGFIGSNLVKRICEEVPSAKVVGIDSVNDYYDVALKEFRLNELSKYESFTFIKGNIANKELITEIFTKYKPAVVVNLAAQAGVRYSITNPDAYVEANLIGFYNILEACRHSYDDGETGVEHLVYAMALAADDVGVIERVAVSIQGMTSVYAHHFFGNLPRNYTPSRTLKEWIIKDGAKDRYNAFYALRLNI